MDLMYIKDQSFFFLNRKKITTINTKPAKAKIQTGVSFSLYGLKVTEMVFPLPISDNLYAQVKILPDFEVAL